jgi:hypothetical protein
MHYICQAVDYLREVWQQVEIKDLLALFGALFGATWAFYKLIQSGGLHPLLDLKVSGKFVSIASHEYLLCSMEVKNVHLRRVLVEYAGLRVYSIVASAPVAWRPWATFPVFDGHQKIWSGESIRDRILIAVPGEQNVFRIEFRIARRYRWYQLSYKWQTGRSSWSAVAIVNKESAEKAGRK